MTNLGFKRKKGIALGNAFCVSSVYLIYKGYTSDIVYFLCIKSVLKIKKGS